MTTADPVIRTAPRPPAEADRLRTPFAARWRAAWRVDVLPSLWGALLGLVVPILVPLAIVLLVPRDVAGFEIGLNGPAEWWAMIMIVVAIIACAESALSRREAIAGGWSRREQLEVLAVKATLYALLAGIGQFVLTLATGAISDAFSAMLPAGAVIELTQPALSPLTPIVAALAALVAAHAPLLIVVLARVHWLAVAGGATVLLVLQTALSSAYILSAYPVAGESAATAMWWGDAFGISAFAVALVLGAAVVIGTHLAARRAPIARYRA